MKICSKCKEEKPLSEFYKKSTSKARSNTAEINTYRSECKLCKKQYDETNKNWRKAYNREYRKTNMERLEKNRKIYYRDNFEMIQAKSKLYHAANKEERNDSSRQWRKENEEKVRLIRKRYIEQNPERYYEQKRLASNKHYKENRQSILNKQYLRNKKRYHSDSLFKCKCLVRNAVREGFRKRSFHKKHKTDQILKCSFEYFFNYLKKQFKEGMIWKNHGEWEIDHIVPLSLAETEEDVIALSHYSNFQPLWKEENGPAGKGDKLILDMISPENKIRYKDIISRNM
jgi:hypothetical protein